MRQLQPQRSHELPRREPSRWRALQVAVLAVIVAACANQQVAQQREALSKQLDLARYQRASRCTPQELAVAEANYRFAQLELDQGNMTRAEEHLAVATAAADKAVQLSVPCTPDTDQDGLHDRVDQCVNEPGPQENKGCPWSDTDKDGVTDNLDKCVDVPGPPENAGCPWGDTDQDGLTDEIDQCPVEPEDQDGFMDEDGCPEPDNDGDTVPDMTDRCPMESGPVEHVGCPVMDRDGDGFRDDTDKCPDDPGIPEYEGCPPSDRDDDGVPDHIDKCPDEHGVIQEQGCPKKYTLIVLQKDRIEIKEQVHFANNQHVILQDSFALLDQIATALRDNPRMKLNIDGHTDSKADDTFNLKLSQRRAEAVRDYLVTAGIGSDRLRARGFGETMPIASNRTETGRALNRRVEFNIVHDAEAAVGK